MKVLIVVTDKASQLFSFSVSAVSLNHAINKAEKHCDNSNIWKKRIQSFNTYYCELPEQYKKFPFPLIKIK